MYDNVIYNKHILLDLPVREATGIITKDEAKPHHAVTMVNTPTWTTLTSGLGVIGLDGTEYLQCLNASCADLGFTSGDYSLGLWWKITDDTQTSQILMGRYELNVGGWELYWYSLTNLLTLRHHHAGGTETRSACYSPGWLKNVWNCMGISRSEENQYHYLNGTALTVVGAVENAEATTSDLVMGSRYTKNANFITGNIWRPRAWNRVLTATEWRIMYELEKRWFE